jgi:hypothetical protein
MFDRFLSTFSESTVAAPGAWPNPAPQAGWEELLSAHGGATFDRGMYRLHLPETSRRADELIAEAHPQLRGIIQCFGYDWLGRQFALDLAAPEAESVRMVEPGTGEILVLPASFTEFHESLLLEYRDAALASGFFASWSADHPDALPLKPDRCVGYRIPLFLGGRDDLENLEETDLWVYWAISAQLIAQTRNVPPGTQVSGVRVA